MKRIDWTILGGITLVSLGMILLLRHLEPALGRDSVFYVDLAHYWADNGFAALAEYHSPFWIPPLYLWLGQLLVQYGIPPESVLVGINIVCGSLLGVICAGIAYEITQNRKIALCSAALMAVNPIMLNLAIQSQRDILYLFVCGLGIYFACAAIRQQKRWYWSCAGALFGLSALIRYETLEIIPCAGFYFIYQLCRKEGKDMMKNAVLITSAFLITAVIAIYIMGVQEYFLDIYHFYFNRFFKRLWGLTW